MNSRERNQERWEAAQGLVSKLGIRADRLYNLLEVFTPDELRKIHLEIGAVDLQVLGNRTRQTLRQLRRALELAGNDTVARNEILRMATFIKRGISAAQIEQALTELVQFMERYLGRVTGDFASRYRRTVHHRADPAQAHVELALAVDILEGNTPLGKDLSVEGIPESTSPRHASVARQRTPEFRVTGLNIPARLVEVKRIGRDGRRLSRNSFRNNLGTAIGQVVEQSKYTGERGGFIRLDARHTSSTTLTAHDFFRQVNGELLALRGM